MGNLYLGNQKSALNKAFVNEGISDYITVGLCYTTAESYKEANDDLSVYAPADEPTNMFDNDSESYFNSMNCSYFHFKSSKGTIKEVVFDAMSTYWDNGLTIYGTNEEDIEFGNPTYNREHWEEAGFVPMSYNVRDTFTCTLTKQYKYLVIYSDRDLFYSFKVKV